MKYAFFSFLFLAFGLQVVAQNDTYTINGKITQATPVIGKVYLQYINDRGQPIVLDSAVIQPNNTFQIKNKLVNGGGFFLVDILQKQKIFLILEGNETISLSANGSATPENPGGIWEAKGSANVEYLTKIEKMNLEMRTKVAGWNKAVAQAQKMKDNARLQQIQQDFDSSQKGILEKIRAMIPEMGTNLVALHATNYLLMPPTQPDQELPLLTELSDKFMKVKPENPIVKTFYQQVLRIRGVDVGIEAPEIAQTTPGDSVFKLSSLRGKYVLIDFWASWCGPCRQENPNVVRLYAKYKAKGFEIFGVSLDNDKNAWTRAIEKDMLTWQHVSDLQGWGNAGAVSYGVNAIPVTFLLDPQGKVIAKNLRGESLEVKLQEIFKD
jgi:thiol-disulfide isomerase/thioredoxin